MSLRVDMGVSGIRRMGQGEGDAHAHYFEFIIIVGLRNEARCR